MIQLLILLVVCGVVLWFVETYIPMAEPFRMAIRVVVALCLLLYLLQVFGILGGAGVPSLRFNAR